MIHKSKPEKTKKMKTKKIIIKIETKQQFTSRINGYMKALDKTKYQKAKDETLSIGSVSELNKILTPKRIELLARIKDCKPKSIYELATIVSRKQENVQKDITFLANLGLIELVEKKEGRLRKVPKVNYDILDFQLPLVTSKTCQARS